MSCLPLILSYLSAKQEDASADLLFQLAHKVSLSPALYARLVLERYAEHMPPESLPLPPTPSPSVLVKQWMKNPHSIPDPSLQLHVKTVCTYTIYLHTLFTSLSLSLLLFQCFLKDADYGPLAENIKWSAY